MGSLWQRSRRRGEERSITTIDEYIEAVTTAGLWGQPVPGVTQTLPGQAAERAPAGFADLARQYMGSSSVVFACMLARLSVFSATRFQYQRFRGGRPSELYGDQSLGLLERPWEGGTTGDLLARMITDADLAGNSYWVATGGEMVRLRPDWVDIALAPREYRAGDGRPGTLGWRKIGYLYYEDGIRDDRGVPLLPDEVAHFAPIPDPLASYRGMSWLTPLIRDVGADTAMTKHKARFMANAATPNMVIKHAPQVTPEQARKFKLALDAEYAGADNAGKTMHLGGGADLTVVGQSFKEIDLRQVQGAGETRIAAAAGVPPIIVGLSEGLQAATYSNYGQARRRFADGTLHPLWGNAAGSLERIRPAPQGSRLWHDPRDIAFLREDSKDAAEIAGIQSRTIRTLVDGGYEPGSVVAAVNAGDFGLLVHTGFLSVQLQRPGEAKSGAASAVDPVVEDDRALPSRLEIARA
jgi:phage portal protein BeeE